MKKLLPVLLLMTLTTQSQTIFPLKISENKRYFVTQQNKPFLYHAETGWQIFTQLTTEEAVEYLLFRKSQGFNTIQVQIVMAPEQVNRYGQKPFDGDVDFSRPNEAYHDHISTILSKADSLGLLIAMVEQEKFIHSTEAFFVVRQMRVKKFLRVR